MQLSPEKIADLRVKHLEMLQAVISRMAGQSASVKTYCITLVGALIGISASTKSPVIMLAAIIAAVTFSEIDTRYLLLERRYIILYHKVASACWDDVTDFSMDVTYLSDNQSESSIWSVSRFYVLIITGITSVFIATALAYGHF